MDKFGFSLEPDPWMRWIYDPSDPQYHSDEAKDLRDRRAAALRNAPRWMLEAAAWNDDERRRARKQARDAAKRRT